ncbi:histone-lysine N-methyltransferase SETD2-like [Aricia agestis]|uniref:histone-lysine N-methyltransferase SETD2-like n=1 Tax=Aricia agestis TaxID=91739 RepID=UPI001C209804|nr:histone-lysine N-methyltransferase SETD2-like [Aricia agestis]
MDLPKGSSDGEDIPSDFFDDFAKEDFIEGLSVVDEWDNEEPEKLRDDANSLDDVEDLRDLIEDDRRKETQKMRQDKDRRRSSSEARMDDFIKPGSRRDPNKTNEAIKRDKELKVKQHIAKHLEEDLRPPGTELDDYYEESKKNEKNEKNFEDPPQRSSPQEMYESSEKSSPKQKMQKKRSLSPVHHRSPGKLQDAAERFYGRPGKYRVSPGRFRESPGRYRHGPGRLHQERTHRTFGRNQEPPPRYERRMYSSRKSPPFLRHPRYEPHRRSRSPHHHPGYRKERRYASPGGSPPRMSRRSRSSRSPRRHYERSRSRSPRRSSDYVQPHKEYIPPYPYTVGPQPYPAPANFIPGMSVDPNMPPAQYDVPQPYPVYNPYPYDMNPPQPVPAPIPAPGNPGLVPTLTTSQQLIPSDHTTDPSTNSMQEPADALAKLVADGILSHEDYLKLAPNKGALLQMDTNTKTDVLKRCHSAVSKLDELMPSNRVIVGLRKKTRKSIAPQFFSPLKKKPIAEFNFTEISASAIALKNKQIIDTIVSTLDLHDLVNRPKKVSSANMKDAAVQTTSSHCDKCTIREATSFTEVGTSIDQEHFSSSAHTQVLEQDLQNSKSVFTPSGSTSVGSAPISFAHMTPAQLVSQLVARAKTLKQSDNPSGRPPNQYQGRNPYDDRRGAPSYPSRSNYNQYRY